MRLKSFFLTTIFSAIISTAFAADKITLHLEVRFPKSAQFDTNANLEFVTDTTAEDDLLIRKKQQDDDSFRIFQQSFNLLARERRRAIVIYTHTLPKNQPEQVFLLSISRKPKPIDWTNWRRADYIETNAGWNFIREYKSADRSTNVPPNSFELRYRIE
jgi:hypothetical protein